MSTTPADSTQVTRKPISRRAVVLGLLVLAIALFAAGVPTWITAHGTSVTGPVTATVSGSSAAPGVSAAALIVAAAGLALGLSGRFAQRVVGAVVVLAGGLAAVSSASVLASPQGPGADAVAEITGVAQASSVTVSPALVVCLLCAALVVLAGAVVLFRRITPRGTSRYDAVATTETRQVATELGADTVSDARADASPEADRSAGPGRAPLELWDAMSRGDDPT